MIIPHESASVRVASDATGSRTGYDAATVDSSYEPSNMLVATDPPGTMARRDLTTGVIPEETADIVARNNIDVLNPHIAYLAILPQRSKQAHIITAVLHGHVADEVALSFKEDGER